MATLGSRGLDEGGLAAELAVQIVAAARAAEHVDVQAREHVLLELRSGDRDFAMPLCRGVCKGDVWAARWRCQWMTRHLTQ